MFKYASLFSGIGGFETALDRLGGKCVFACEIDKHARKAYKIIYNHTLHGDIMKINANEIPEHDLLTAGFPCQAFSIAGKRKGFEDTRGTLFFDVARIVAEKKPKVLLLENVKGLVSHDKGKTLEVILTTLSDLNYTVDFEVLNSKYFGVPQNRERIFIVAVLGGRTEKYKIIGNNSVSKAKKRLNKLGLKTFNFSFPNDKEVTSKLIDVLEKNVNEKYYIKEEKARKLLEELNGEHQAPNKTFLIDGQGRTNKKLKPLQISPTLRSETHGNEPKIVEKIGLKLIGRLDIKGADCVKRVYDPAGICPTLTTMGGGYREPKIIEPQQFSTNGEGRRFKEDGEPAFTVTTIDRHGVAIGQQPNYRVRKLTPLECLRLQGFPDEYYHKLKKAGISDSQIYKRAGNAVTVNVVYEVAKEVIKLIQ